MKRTLVLAAALILTGCLGDEPAEVATAVPDADAPADAPRTEDGTLLHVARHAAGSPVDVTQWMNGTFRIEQHGRLGPLPGLPVEPRGVVVHDVTDLVPIGVPVRVFAEVNAELSHGDVDLGLWTPDGSWRTGNWNTPRGGFSSFETGLVLSAAGTVAVILEYDEVEPQPEFPYTLSIRVVSDPELLVNGIVTGVTLPADARFQVEAIGAPRTEGPEVDAFSLHVFAPDGAALATFPLASGTTPIALPAGSPAGEYAFLLSQGGRNARVLVEGAPAPMRPLALEWVNGEEVPLDASGRGTAAATFDRVPLLVGVFFSAPNVAQNVDVALSGPAGPIFADRIDTEVPWVSFDAAGVVSFTNGFGWDSLWGPPGLRAGTYEAEVAFERAASAQPAVAQVFAAFHVR